MTTEAVPNVLPYEDLGVAPVVNACGIYTDLGGSCLSDSVWAALTQANRTWASVPELLDATGARIAALVGSEAARVTPGASPAIVLAIAACIAGRDGALNEQLPSGAPPCRRLLMQRAHRYKYARLALLAGAEISEVGEARGTSLPQLEAALDQPTAAILHPAHLDRHENAVPLTKAAQLAAARGVPVVVDAAYLSYPTDLIPTFTRDGADLVCFSAKYFWGPNAGGFLAGRRELVEIVAELDFTHYEGGPYRTFGRGFKLDRTTIVATVLALEEWLRMDHPERWAAYERRVEVLRERLADVPGIRTAAKRFTLDERLVDDAPNALVVEPERPGAAETLERALADGTPRILCVRLDQQLVFAVETMTDDQDAVVAARIAELTSDLS